MSISRSMAGRVIFTKVMQASFNQNKLSASGEFGYGLGLLGYGRGILRLQLTRFAGLVDSSGFLRLQLSRFVILVDGKAFLRLRLSVFSVLVDDRASLRLCFHGS